MKSWKIRHILEQNFKSWEIADKLIKKIKNERKAVNVNYLLLQFYSGELERISFNCDRIDEILRSELRD